MNKNNYFTGRMRAFIARKRYWRAVFLENKRQLEAALAVGITFDNLPPGYDRSKLVPCNDYPLDYRFHPDDLKFWYGIPDPSRN